VESIAQEAPPSGGQDLLTAFVSMLLGHSRHDFNLQEKRTFVLTFFSAARMVDTERSFFLEAAP
jgi:hypothetical protein